MCYCAVRGDYTPDDRHTEVRGVTALAPLCGCLLGVCRCYRASERAIGGALT